MRIHTYMSTYIQVQYRKNTYIQLCYIYRYRYRYIHDADKDDKEKDIKSFKNEESMAQAKVKEEI